MKFLKLILLFFLVSTSLSWKHLPEITDDNIKTQKALLFSFAQTLEKDKPKKETPENQQKKKDITKEKKDPPNSSLSSNSISLDFPKMCFEKPSGQKLEVDNSLHHIIPKEMLKIYFIHTIHFLSEEEASTQQVNEFYNLVNQKLILYCDNMREEEVISNTDDFTLTLNYFFLIFIWGTGNIVPGPPPKLRLNDPHNALDKEILKACTKNSMDKINRIHSFLETRNQEYEQLSHLLENEKYIVPSSQKNAVSSGVFRQFSIKKSNPLDEFASSKEFNIFLKYEYENLQVMLNKELVREVKKLYSPTTVNNLIDALFFPLTCTVNWEKVNRYRINNPPQQKSNSLLSRFKKRKL